MTSSKSKANRAITILFSFQFGLFFLGLLSEHTTLFSAQWIAWTLAGLISLIIGVLAFNMLLAHTKFKKITALALVCNVLGIAVALFIHYSPNLG